MPDNTTLINTENIVQVTPGNFDAMALSVFRYQYLHNSLYRNYCQAINVNAENIVSITDIPFLPITFFKTHQVATGVIPTDAVVFESSGTTGTVNSKHYVADAALYRSSLLAGFSQFYGHPANYVFLALLPSYLERKNASLVHMANELMLASGQPENGFYINEWAALHQQLTLLETQQRKVLLLGVTFALLDFAETHAMQLQHTIVMETGGMKGRRTEWTRNQVHSVLKDQFQVPAIHAEYGMTELLSQAYSAGRGRFSPTHTMKVLARDINDPLTTTLSGQGCINIIDLANINSCSFIATEDIGHVHSDGTFDVLGRLDNSALRGCSLMAV